MAFADSGTLERLRKEEAAVDQQSMHALQVAKMLKNHPEQYDLAQKKAEALLAKKTALREQIAKMETA
jgi:Ni,Fe-hydrogenase maturation factor